MKTITLTIIAALCLFSVNAQWTDQTDVNTSVAPINDLQTYSDAVGTNDGQTYVVFWKPVSAPTNYELRVQLLDADGYKQFGDDGLLVSDEIPMGTYTVTMTITTDDDNNLFIGATGTGGAGSGYVFKIDADGNNLWGSSGINVGTGNIVTVLPLLNDDVIVSWMDSGSSSAKIQKYDSSGNAVWNNPLDVDAGGGSTAPAHLFELSDGGFIEIFHKLLGFGINSNLYAQRFDSEGEAQWDDAVELSDNATAFNRFYDYVQIDDTIYIGYFASQGLRFDSFLQRLNPDGTLPWDINGVDFDTAQTDYEMNTKIAHDSDSQYIYAICTYSNTNQGQFGEYVQKFDKETGERQFTDNAKEVFPIGSSKTHQGELQLINNHPVFLIASEESPSGTPLEISAVELDENGDFTSENEMVPMATYNGEKDRIHFTKAVNEQAVAVFSEQKDDGIPRVYAQNFVPNSEVECATPTDLTATGITAGEVELSWTENGNATAWEIKYGTPGFNPDTEGTAVEDTDDLGETLFDLEADTTYEVYVRANCGDDTYSDWSVSIIFTTEGTPCETPTGLNVTEITQTTAKIGWTENGSATVWEIKYGEPDFNPDTEGMAVEDTDEPGETLFGLEANTTYEVYVRANCGDDNYSDWSESQIFTTEELSVKENGFEGFSYYPNPVKNTLHLKANFPLQHLAIFNLLGQKVLENKPNSDKVEVNTGNLQSGLYLVKVEINGSVKSFKLIKK